VNEIVKKKAVQTELMDQEYDLLQEVAARTGITIKQGPREAVQPRVRTQIPISEDPLLKVEPIKTGVGTDSSKLDRLLYGERG